MNEKISRDFAYFLKREHLYSNYRAYLNRKKISYVEYKFWSDVYANFCIFLVEKYECEKDVILN
jgi:hypothetical protein